MALIQDWVPPTRGNWELILYYWQIGYPALSLAQLATSWYGMGKTSVESRLNIPGRVAWFFMECPGFTLLLYIMNTLPKQVGITHLPWQNKILAGLFVIHYLYRAVLFPFIQPSMSPIHAAVFLLAATFQVVNATCIGAYLAAYGPVTDAEWSAARAPFSTAQFIVGVAIFAAGLVGNYLHDEELREIRRTEQRRQEKVVRGQQQKGKTRVSVDKHYSVPEAMLFRYVLYPHYFCEWVEWFGFWVASGWSVPARAFLVNEITAMLPRTIRGRQWYINRFGEEKIRKKWTVVPGVY
ncbi:3-oxo-5-alpha-steroid 4-dehydrogenase [Sodiomyces alkalinus F11]|uniref:3-oxo-5-alpha-steroid 4-dehydrogenase n=1 Tax=Sodiomyces alkalinus (strain CBS 110278 / VKM F-3762 / F11) TaxID=1314773 RepID=A0A3N2PL24_SODAK|nr:3-oxo-5-alpha-steroid 4-dehydrogenase [Sodiomyces alkalinus F11]ROT35228.1 3-oxo-5-alpha-steroid 4-dehydrogenase [Sodiomyces alkalinus F11]